MPSQPVGMVCRDNITIIIRQFSLMPAKDILILYSYAVSLPQGEKYVKNKGLKHFPKTGKKRCVCRREGKICQAQRVQSEINLLLC
jgi:hypothetical protein